MQIGKCSVRDLPDDLAAGTPIEVRFQYTASGRLQVLVQVTGHAGNLTHEMTRENNLSKADRERWRERVLGSAPV